MLGLMTSIRPADAAVGELLREIQLPAGSGPNGHFCLSGIGTSIAVVPGGLVGRPEFPILVVTSCFASTTSVAEQAQAPKLFFFDPSTNPATLVLTVTTAVSPPNGWGALALRGDKADLLGCGSAAASPVGAHQIYAIPLSKDFAITPNPTTIPIFRFNANPGHGFEICDGVAWDSVANRVYESPDVFHTVSRYTEAGVADGTVAVPAGCNPIATGPNGTLEPGNSGVAVGGQSLFLGCADDPNIYQVDKTTGALIRSFPSGAASPNCDPATGCGRTEDLECDPVTFGSQGKDALWSKDAYTNHLFAFEIPKGTCGLAGGAAVAVPALGPLCAADGLTDTDGDGLLDCWEKPSPASAGAGGLPCIDFDGDGVCDYILCTGPGGTDCADPYRKDVFVELDWLETHPPNQAAINSVISRFAIAPTASVINPINPMTGTRAVGVALHVQVDPDPLKDPATGNTIPHNSGNAFANDKLAFEPYTGPGTWDFDVLKAFNFGTLAERTTGTAADIAKRLNAKRQAFRYGIVHHLMDLPPIGTTPDTTSGAGEVYGNDFVVTLGGGNIVNGHPQGDQNQQAATFMHELGHTLGLRHGGDQILNCLPNYLSIMSYSRQMAGAPISAPQWLNNPPLTGVLDYSRIQLLPLDETALDERIGIAGINAAGGNPDLAGHVTVFGPGPGTVVAANGPNNNGAINWDGDGLPAEPLAATTDINRIVAADGTVMCKGDSTAYRGFDDWRSLKYDIRSSLDFADGVRLSLLGEDRELTTAQAEAVSPDSDGDGVVDFRDNCPTVPNPTQADSDGDGIGDACQVDAVLIDIRPRRIPNIVNLTSPVPLAVAIFGSATFDVTRINPATVRLSGARVPQSNNRFACAVLHVNGDNFPDLVCIVDKRQLVLPADNAIAVLTGRTFANRPFRGEDSIQIVRGRVPRDDD